jgi:uroporphyrinogen-III synthase
MRSGTRWATVATRSDRPLVGVGVVVTRDEDADEPLSGALRSLGATVLSWPTIRTSPVSDPGPLRAVLDRLESFDWVVFTSPRAVEAVAEGSPAWPAALRVAAVGRSTKAAAESMGWRVEVVPGTQTAEALVSALGAEAVGAGTRVLFPASEIAHATLESGLRGLGAEVVRVTAYRTVPAPLDRDSCAHALDSGQVGVISFTSPSSVANLRAALGDRLFAAAARQAVMAAIGPTTADAVRAAGAARVIEASQHSLAGLAERIAEWGSDTMRQERHELSDQ